MRESPSEIRKAIRATRELWIRSRKATKQYERLLKGVAYQVGSIVSGIAPNGVVDETNSSALHETLRAYAELLRPWAVLTASRMIAEVGQRDKNAWLSMGKEIGRSLNKEIESSPTGPAMKALLDEQVTLITSLPIQASKRVHELTMKGLVEGGRAKSIAEEIMRTEHVTKSRAVLIARTEVARTGSILSQVRAEHLGSTQYTWRTVGDSDVRALHKHLNGQVFSWDNPPVAGSNGEHANAGQIYNCRCFAEPILPELE